MGDEHFETAFLENGFAVPTTAFYALSADPITVGHLWVIQSASQMFERVMIGIGQNANKTCAFSARRRFEMTRDVISKAGLANCEVREMELDDWTVKVAKELGYTHLIRGVRNSRDFEYEMELASFNRTLEPTIQTVFLPTPPELSLVSSSFVKSMIGLKDWEDIVAPLVPSAVMPYLYNFLTNQILEGKFKKPHYSE